ncbi:hypothetical protein GCM10009111_26360 [Colwellia asteriadis]|uniref:Uncharacterized protein n=1 Tax=Colwellia asteriadis TaxID=517723 RepID=A0ABN1L958_9GAMM
MNIDYFMFIKKKSLGFVTLAMLCLTMVLCYVGYFTLTTVKKFTNYMQKKYAENKS